METTHLAAIEPQPAAIVIVARVGHDDQYECSDLTHCAVRIERGALDSLRKRLDFVAVNSNHFDLWGVDFRSPDGIEARFFALNPITDDDPISLKLAQALQEKADPDQPWGSEVVFRGSDAEEVWEWAEQAEDHAKWTVGGQSLLIYTPDWFFIEDDYDYVAGGIQTPELHFGAIEGHFLPRKIYKPRRCAIDLDTVPERYRDVVGAWNTCLDVERGRFYPEEGDLDVAKALAAEGVIEYHCEEDAMGKTLLVVAPCCETVSSRTRKKS